MSESVNVENKKQNHLKPPRSRRRIACEILAGTALGLVALRVVYRPFYELFADSFEGILGHLLVYVFIFPPLYGLATAVGVYLVGNIGKQTGSFWATLGWSFLLTFLASVAMVFFLITTTEEEKIIRLAVKVLVLLLPPILATVGFNLTRRYKEPPSS